MTDDNCDINDRMFYSYQKYANTQRIRLSVTTYDKIMALLAEMEEAGNARAKQLRSEMSWTRRVTGAD